MSCDATDRSWRIKDERFFRDRSSEASFSWKDYVLILCSMLVVALSGFVLGVDAGGAAAAGSGSVDSGSSVFFEDGVNVSQFRTMFSDSRETAWCLYGSENGSDYVVDRVEWIGKYGESDSISYSCERYLPGFLGSVHTHPSRFNARLSRRDAHTLGKLGSRSFSGVAVGRGSAVKVRLFDEDSLVDGFDSIWMNGREK